MNKDPPFNALVERAIKHDQAAWTELYHLCQPLLESSLKPIDHLGLEVEDVVQQVWEVIFRRGALNRYDASRGQFKNWLSYYARAIRADIGKKNSIAIGDLPPNHQPHNYDTPETLAIMEESLDNISSTAHQHVLKYIKGEVRAEYRLTQQLKRELV